MKQWREVHEFFEKGTVPFQSLEPSALTYKSVQRDQYQQTLSAESKSLKKYNEKQKSILYANSRPSFKQAIGIFFAGAAVESGVSLCVNIRSKCKKKKLCELSEKDWVDIVKKIGIDFSKGGIRGVSIYLLTNYTATPTAVANALATASFGMAEQAHLLRAGKLTEEKFIENSEMICLDAGVSALSSFAGQVLIPVPILGAVIGNSIGVMMYQIAKDNLSMREQRILKQHIESIQQLSASLDREYKAYIKNLAEDMETFLKIMDAAFVVDVKDAFDGSVKLAKKCGVPAGEILDTREKISDYFTK